MCSPGVTARDEVLAGLAAIGPGADAVSLLGQVRDLARFIDRAQGQLARLAATADAIDGASEAGYSSVAAFLRHGCGRSAARAGELVAAGRALRSLEATEKALTAGEISFDAAHVICRTAAQIPDAAMAQLAEEQMLAFARAPSPEGPTVDGPAANTDPDGDRPEQDSTDLGADGPDSTGPAGSDDTGQPGSPWWAPPGAGPGPAAPPRRGAALPRRPGRGRGPGTETVRAPPPVLRPHSRRQRHPDRRVRRHPVRRDHQDRHARLQPPARHRRHPHRRAAAGWTA